MRAIVAHAAKDLRIEESRRPSSALRIRVRVAAGGICGSDLHYFNHGGFGVVRLREPMVSATRSPASSKRSARSAPNQGRRSGRGQSEPALQRLQVLPRGPTEPLPRHALLRQRDAFPACAGRFSRGARLRREPGPRRRRRRLAGRGGDGRTARGLPARGPARRIAAGQARARHGSGPIGALSAIAARRAGAAEIVVTDVADGALSFAREVGVDATFNVAAKPDAFAPLNADKGAFDVMFEASGAEAALRGGLDVVRPGGVIVQLGLGGEMKLPVNAIVAKEIELRGTFRFHEEFGLAVTLWARAWSTSSR